MSKRNNRDYLYLIWKEPESRRNYTIGELSKNGQFEFSYGHEINEAINKGFELLISFENKDAVYKSDTLFPTFSSRLPDSKRRGIEKILLKYGLEEFDAYKLLKRSKARLPIDNLEFIDPLDKDDIGAERIFEIAGTRHYMFCKGENCSFADTIEVGDELKLSLEPENKHDENAVEVYDKFNNKIGYIPRYYSEAIKCYLEKGRSIKCNVIEYNKNLDCTECIKVKFILL